MNRAEKMLHELWMRFLTEINEDTKKVPEELLGNELTREAIEYMEKAAYTKEQLEAYDKWKINAMTERSALNDAKKEGRAEGRAEGRTEGVEIGENNKAVTIALKMLRKGVSVEDICDFTGLSQQQVEKLKTELQYE